MTANPASATSAPPLIAADAVTRILPGVVQTTLVRDISVTIDRGEFVAVTGPSGSGKSSLLYLLGLLDIPTSGDIKVKGRSTIAMDEAERARTRLELIGFVFQFHFLLPEFSALGNVMVPMRKRAALSDAAIRTRAEQILEDLGLADHRHKLPEQMSGGQRQRVAIARALANDPPVILADEPTGSLDSRSSTQVFDILERLVDTQHRTVITVTHDPVAAARTRRRIHLVDGAIVSDTATTSLTA